jgi:cyclophilin family peptidyl-prolyl cis-trans isomerase
LDGQNVVFGRVIEGMSAIRAIEQLETVNEKPSEAVKIVKTGAYKME